MTYRDVMLDAARRAGGVLSDHGMRDRIDRDGYTRIDPFAIAEHEEIAVMNRPLDKLLGAYIHAERPGIMVTVSRGPGVLHMTCAHELGHYFLKHDTHYDTKIDYGTSGAIQEQQADFFAYSLMAPSWLIKKILAQKRWDASSLRNPAVLYQLSLRLGISYTSMVWTLVRIKWLPQAEGERLAKVQPKRLKTELTKGGVPKDGGDVWLLDDTDHDWILEPHKNDSFVFELPNHASAGYLWSLEDLRAEGYTVEPLHGNAHQSTTQTRGEVSTIGGFDAVRYVVSATPEERIRFEERTTFKMAEGRPWEQGNPDPENQRVFNAEYERMEPGLDSEERKRRVEEVRASA